MIPLSFLISTLAGMASDKVPLLPLTLRLLAATETSTPFGKLIGFLATRDMNALLKPRGK